MKNNSFTKKLTNMNRAEALEVVLSENFWTEVKSK